MLFPPDRVLRREEQDRVLVFVTNHLTLAAATVAEV